MLLTPARPGVIIAGRAGGLSAPERKRAVFLGTVFRQPGRVVIGGRETVKFRGPEEPRPESGENAIAAPFRTRSHPPTVRNTPVNPSARLFGDPNSQREGNAGSADSIRKRRSALLDEHIRECSARGGRSVDCRQDPAIIANCEVLNRAATSFPRTE